MFKSIVIVSPFEYSSPCCEGFAAWCEHQGQGEKELQRGKQVTNIRYTLSFINMSRPTWTKWHRDSVDFNKLRTKISRQSRRWWNRLRWKANCKRICANRSAENSNIQKRKWSSQSFWAPIRPRLSAWPDPYFRFACMPPSLALLVERTLKCMKSKYRESKIFHYISSFHEGYRPLLVTGVTTKPVRTREQMYAWDTRLQWLNHAECCEQGRWAPGNICKSLCLKYLDTWYFAGADSNFHHLRCNTHLLGLFEGVPNPASRELLQ